MVADDPYLREFAIQRSELDARAAELAAKEAQIAAARERLRADYDALDIAERHYKSFLDRKSGKIVSLDDARPQEAAVPIRSGSSKPVENDKGAAPAKWRAEIQRIVLQSERGLTNDQVKAEIRKTELSSQLDSRDFARKYYNAVTALDKKGIVVYRDQRVYSPRAYEQYVEDLKAGRVVDEKTVAKGHFSPMGAEIIRIVGESRIGLRRYDLVAELDKNPLFSESMAKHPSYIYNVLSKLIVRNRLEKVGDIYRIPLQSQEASSAKG